MSFNRGGQRRTIELGCGWRCVGHPQEVNAKFERHKRFCNTCSPNIKLSTSFNKFEGNNNGWDGIKGNRRVNEIHSSAVYDGQDYNFRSKTHSIDTALRQIDDMTEEELEAKSKMGTAPVITKSMKKRQKKQAKAKANATATATAEEEEDEDEEEDNLVIANLLNILGKLGKELGVEVLAFK